MNTRTRTAERLAHRATVVLLAVTTGGLLAGCGPESAEPADGPVTSASPAEPSSEPSPEETETPEEPTPSEEPEPDDGLAGALLPAADVPGFNDEFAWSERATTAQEPGGLAGTCHKFEMTSIGAEEVAYRTYEPAAGDGSMASELVASFPDEATAQRAFDVLRSWRKDCGKAIKKFERTNVGDLVDVPTEVGSGGWYMLTYGPAEDDPDSVYFDAQGITLVGSRIAVLRLATVGQDYNYEVGQEPMVAAVQGAASLL
ncbi:MAG: hypothetical protein WBQ50_06625 [Nocardioides sp.]